MVDAAQIDRSGSYASKTKVKQKLTHSDQTENIIGLSEHNDPDALHPMTRVEMWGNG